MTRVIAIRDLQRQRGFNGLEEPFLTFFNPKLNRKAAMRVLHLVVIPFLVAGVAAHSTLQRRDDAAGTSIEITDTLGTSDDAVNVGNVGNVDNVENVDNVDIEESADESENVGASDDVRVPLF
jgi:hypothetical protein